MREPEEFEIDQRKEIVQKANDSDELLREVKELINAQRSELKEFVDINSRNMGLYRDNLKSLNDTYKSINNRIDTLERENVKIKKASSSVFINTCVITFIVVLGVIIYYFNLLNS